MNYGKLITSKVLKPYQVDEICRQLIMGRINPADIARNYKVSYWQINRIHNVFINIYKPLSTSNVSFRGWTESYYKTEDDILKELELNYDHVELKGWELEQYNKL